MKITTTIFPYSSAGTRISVMLVATVAVAMLWFSSPQAVNTKLNTRSIWGYDPQQLWTTLWDYYNHYSSSSSSSSSSHSTTTVATATSNNNVHSNSNNNNSHSGKTKKTKSPLELRYAIDAPTTAIIDSKDNTTIHLDYIMAKWVTEPYIDYQWYTFDCQQPIPTTTTTTTTTTTATIEKNDAIAMAFSSIQPILIAKNTTDMEKEKEENDKDELQDQTIWRLSMTLLPRPPLPPLPTLFSSLLDHSPSISTTTTTNNNNNNKNDNAWKWQLFNTAAETDAQQLQNNFCIRWMIYNLPKSNDHAMEVNFQWTQVQITWANEEEEEEEETRKKMGMEQEDVSFEKEMSSSSSLSSYSKEKEIQALPSDSNMFIIQRVDISTPPPVGIQINVNGRGKAKTIHPSSSSSTSSSSTTTVSLQQQSKFHRNDENDESTTTTTTATAITRPDVANEQEL